MNIIKKILRRRDQSTQADIWDEHMTRISLADVLAAYRSPAVFQIELAALIDERTGGGKKVIEVGCETAVTSLLLSQDNEKTAIDINPRAVSLVQGAAAQLGNQLQVQVCDMFAMPFADGNFDTVFNAGVIEHFPAEERARALCEYARILKPDGQMIVAFPNHYCPPYRFAYRLMRLLGIWRFPSEYEILDLKEEAALAGLQLQERLTLSRATIFNWLNFLPPARVVYQLLDRFFHYEGYLTVIILCKSRA